MENVFENKTYTNKGEDSKNPIKLKWTASMDKHTEFRGIQIWSQWNKGLYNWWIG